MRAIKKVISAWPLLALLLLADAMFIGLHILLWSTGLLKAVHQLDLEWRMGAPEYYTSLKWLISILALLWLFVRKRELLYFAWATLFLYLLVEDAQNIRILAAAWIADAIDRGPGWFLVVKEFGELAILGIFGAILLGVLGFAYWRSEDEQAKAFSHYLLPWLAALIVFGVGIDTLHDSLSNGTNLSASLAVVEEGGEMIVASVLTALVCLQAFPATRRAAPSVPFQRHVSRTV